MSIADKIIFVTLTISEGTVIKFDNNTKLFAQGKLLANGAYNSHITFTSSKTFPSRGDWVGIVLDGSETSASILKYVDIEYGKTNLELNNSSPGISYSKFENGSLQGIRLNSSRPYI